MSRLVKTDGGSHGALDVEGPDVLPVLLEQRHQEVDGQVDVEDQLVLCHSNVADSDVQAQDLSSKKEKKRVKNNGTLKLLIFLI